MSKSAAPPPPDYSAIEQAQIRYANESIALMREQHEWAKKTYAENKEITDKVVESFLSTQEQQNEWAQADRQRYESVFQPLENALVSDAESYASEERKAIEMGKAQSNVAQHFNAARINAQRELESFGINPADTRYAALDIGVRAQQAAAAAGAGNMAADRADATGRALRADAINIGKGYPTQALQAVSTGMQAGSGANNAGLATTASGANTMGTGVQWGAQGTGALSNAANTKNTSYSNAMDYYSAKQKESSGIGSALGLAAGIGTGFMGLPTASVGGKLLGFNEGGAVGDEPDGGAVPKQVSPSRGRALDDVDAKLTAGEFILPDDVTRWYGEEKLHKMILKAREGKQELTKQSGAISTIHPAAMGAPGAHPRQALEVA